MAYEDFTSFTEVDAEDAYSVTTNKVNVNCTNTNLAGNYVYKDYGANHFDDFEHLIECLFSTLASGDYMFFWACGNTIESWPCNDMNSLNLVNYATPYEFQMRERVSDSQTNIDTWSTPSADTIYYITVAKSGTTITAEIRTGSHLGSLQTTLSYTCNTQAHRYLYCQQGYSNTTLTGYSQNFDIQEGGTEYNESGTANISLNATNSYLAAFNRSPVANLSLTVTVSYVLAAIRSATANLSLTSVVSYLAAFIRNSTANLSVVASALVSTVGNTVVNAVANLSLAASVAYQAAISRAATANLSMAVSATKSFGRSITSTVNLGVSSVVSYFAALTRTFTANIEMSATVSKVAGIIRNSTANLTSAVSASYLATFTRTATENISMTATATRTIGKTITSSASLTLSATASRVFNYVKSAVANLSLTASVITSAAERLPFTSWFTREVENKLNTETGGRLMGEIRNKLTDKRSDLDDN